MAGNDIVGLPEGTDLPLLQNGKGISHHHSLIDIMQDNNESFPVLLPYLLDHIEQIPLVFDIEKGNRLIQKHNVRILRQDHSDPDSLPLSAGKTIQRAVAKSLQIHVLYRPFDNPAVIFGQYPSEQLMGASAERHKLEAGNVLYGLQILR